MKNKKLVIFLGVLVFLIGSLSFVYCDEIGGETTGTIDIGELIGIGVEKIFGSGMEYDKGFIKDFETENSLNINGDEFENIIPKSVSGNPTYIKLEAGNIESADITISEEGTYTFNGKSTPFSVPAGSRIIFMNNEITIEFPDGGEIKEFSDLNLEEIYLTKIKGENVKLPGEHSLDGGDLYYNGKLFVKAGDEVIIDKIEFTELEKDVNLYFEKDFNPANHKDENYFNYEKDKISLGGYGFTADLGTENNVFGDMETEKYIDGQKDPKTRNLEITLNGGNLEISKDKNSKSGLAFNVQGNGDYIIDNSRVVIYSEKDLKLEEQKLFVKVRYKEELTCSYDLNFNEGEHILESNIFKNNKGNELLNGNTRSENIIHKTKNLDKKEVAKIKKAIEDKLGKGTVKDWTGLLNEGREEKIIKNYVEATYSANQNIVGTKISPEGLFVRSALEGVGVDRDGYLFYEYYKDQNSLIPSNQMGLDFIGDEQHIQELIDLKFLQEGVEFVFDESGDNLNEFSQTMKPVFFKNSKDALTVFAAEWAYRKYLFERDFKEHFGDKKLGKITPGEEDFWVTYYWNSGAGAGKGQLTGAKYNTYNRYGDPIVVQGKGRENVYGPFKEGEWVSIHNSRYNAVLGEATTIFMKAIGIFSSP